MLTGQLNAHDSIQTIQENESKFLRSIDGLNNSYEDTYMSWCKMISIDQLRWQQYMEILHHQERSLSLSCVNYEGMKWWKTKYCFKVLTWWHTIERSTKTRFWAIPWFTWITSLLLNISVVSEVIFLTSQPIKRGAWNITRNGIC